MGRGLVAVGLKRMVVEAAEVTVVDGTASHHPPQVRGGRLGRLGVLVAVAWVADPAMMAPQGREGRREIGGREARV